MARPSWKWRAPAANTFPRSAGWKTSSPVGACRLCIVEVSGVGRLLPACTTPVQDGMSVTTNSEKLRTTGGWRSSSASRSAITSAPCASPTTTASCRPWRSGWASPACAIRTRYPKLPVDVSHERYVLDHNRCILCTRCVRVCAEVEGARVWDVGGRGIRSMIVADMNRPWGEARKLHQLRQVRAGVPHRRAGRERLRRWRRWSSRTARSRAWPPGAEAINEEGHGWPPCGWTAARAATCRCSIWTRRILAVGQARRPGLRPAGGCAGVSQGGGRDLVEGAVSSQEDLEKVRTDAPAQQAGGRAGRLRRHRQRSRHAQPDARAQAAGAHLRRRRRRTTPWIPDRWRAGAAAPRRAGARSASRWICTCPAARRRPKPSSSCWASCWTGACRICVEGEIRISAGQSCLCEEDHDRSRHPHRGARQDRHLPGRQGPRRRHAIPRHPGPRIREIHRRAGRSTRCRRSPRASAASAR